MKDIHQSYGHRAEEAPKLCLSLIFWLVLVHQVGKLAEFDFVRNLSVLG